MAAILDMATILKKKMKIAITNDKDLPHQLFLKVWKIEYFFFTWPYNHVFIKTI